MKILILSDIHDHVQHLKKILRDAPQAAALIFCGDLCAPFVVDILAQSFTREIHIVFGNNDGDLFRITQKMNTYPHLHLWGEMFEMGFEDKKIAANHFPEIAHPLAKSGEYDLVCYGHDHHRHAEKIQNTWWVNPGSVMGYQPGKDVEVAPSFALYDTETDQIIFYELQGELLKEVSG